MEAAWREVYAGEYDPVRDGTVCCGCEIYPGADGRRLWRDGGFADSGKKVQAAL